MMSYPNSGCTGAPPPSGKLCADAFTFTFHEEQLKKQKNKSLAGTDLYSYTDLPLH